MLFGPLGWVDAFRAVNSEPNSRHSAGQTGVGVWENNVGWRIDYQVVTPGLAEKIRAATIVREPRFSDHAPLIIDYDYPFSAVG